MCRNSADYSRRRYGILIARHLWRSQALIYDEGKGSAIKRLQEDIGKSLKGKLPCNVFHEGIQIYLKNRKILAWTETVTAPGYTWLNNSGFRYWCLRQPVQDHIALDHPSPSFLFTLDSKWSSYINHYSLPTALKIILVCDRDFTRGLFGRLSLSNDHPHP